MVPFVPVSQEMMPAGASPWLPALQALARRRLALGPTLDAARQRRENAAVEIQRRVRGTTVRHNMDAENLVLAVLKALHFLHTFFVYCCLSRHFVRIFHIQPEGLSLLELSSCAFPADRNATATGRKMAQSDG